MNNEISHFGVSLWEYVQKIMLYVSKIVQLKFSRISCLFFWKTKAIYCLLPTINVLSNGIAIVLNWAFGFSFYCNSSFLHLFRIFRAQLSPRNKISWSMFSNHRISTNNFFDFLRNDSWHSSFDKLNSNLHWKTNARIEFFIFSSTLFKKICRYWISEYSESSINTTLIKY